MKPPDYFVRELAAFDPDLRIRWSTQYERWMVERRVRRALHPGTIKCEDWDDDVIRARDGYLLVGTVSPHGLSRTILEKLKASDLWSNDGWRRVADKMDEYDRTKEEKAWDDFSDDIRSYSAEVYEWLKIRDGRSVFSPGWVE